MSGRDVNAEFARAEAAFRAGNFDKARTGLRHVLEQTGDHPMVLHLLALTEQGADRPEYAQKAFERALLQSPNDPQINNNFANFLDTYGAPEAALERYGRALAANPGFVDALLNRASTLNRLGRLGEAQADLDRLLALDPKNIRALTTRGAIRRSAGELILAASDFQKAIDISATDLAAWHGHALVAADRGDEGEAVSRFKMALKLAPGNSDLVIGLAEALEAMGSDDGLQLLATAVERNPTWIAGQDSLARMRSEAGENAFARDYESAVAKHPKDFTLHMAHWRCLARGSRHAEALAAIGRSPSSWRNREEFRLFEAVMASEAGDLDRADRAFLRLGNSVQSMLAKGRHELRRKRPVQAAALLEPIARMDLRLVAAWAHLGLAWRMIEDPRHEWLYGIQGYYREQSLSIDDAGMTMLATLLRQLHKARAHPLGQSMRGGTQTRGRLLNRTEPEIVNMKHHLAAAIKVYLNSLPPLDTTHPLLNFRNRNFSFFGSWSVRLTNAGFHIDHVHPEGVISSACYIAVPEKANDSRQEGWLTLGGSPIELDLGLEPMAFIKPKPGHLILFPSYLYHATRPFLTGERMSIAFDAIP